MYILDENISLTEKGRLLARGVHARQIGVEVGRLGMKDIAEIIPLLHTLRQPTLFTRDKDFYKAGLRHANYCLVLLDVDFDEVAEYARRFLRHPSFRNRAQRMGKVVRIRHSGLRWWEYDSKVERVMSW